MKSMKQETLMNIAFDIASYIEKTKNKKEN